MERWKGFAVAEHSLAIITSLKAVSERVLESALADPDLVAKCSRPTRKGELRPNTYTTGHFVRTLTPKGWPLAPVRDYLIADAAAMLMSHLAKAHKGKHASNPPMLESLKPIPASEYLEAYRTFTAEQEPALKPDRQNKIAELRASGKTRLADRLERVYRAWATSRQAGALLRRIDGVFPRPIEFTHSEA
jgi:hypothetical protein